MIAMRRFMVTVMVCLYGTMLVSLQPGCGQPSTTVPATETDTEGDSHSHGDEVHDDDHAGESPQDFASAVAQVKELSDAIGSAYAGDDAHAAHDPLHEIGHHLLALPELAAAAKLSSADRKTVDEVAEKLLNAFEGLDDAMHGREGKTYAEVEEDIQTGVQVLESISKSME